MIFLFISCGEKKENDKTKDSKEVKNETKENKVLTQYDLITHSTMGLIFHKNQVSVVFNPNYVKKEIKDEDLSVLNFEPKIEGRLYWDKENILVFQPKEQWQMRQKYKATLDIKKILKNTKTDFEKFDFEFETTGIEIYDFTIDVLSSSPNNPKLVKVYANIFFNDTMDIEKAKAGIKLFKYINGEKIYEPAIIEQDQDKKKIKLISQEIERNAKNEEKLYIEIEKDKLNISESKLKEVKIPVLQNLSVIESLIDNKGKASVTIKFSDILDKDMNLDGFFAVEPAVNFTVFKNDRKVTLDGDFKYGQEYTLTVRKGIKSKWGSEITSDYTKKLKLGDLAPEIEFSSDGIFLTSSNNSKIRFRTRNVNKVNVEVSKIFENNMFLFLQDSELYGKKTRKEDKGYYFWRIGKVTNTQTIEINKEKNKWFQSELDLSKIFEKDKTGLYFIKLSFNEKNIEGDYFAGKSSWEISNFIYDSAKVIKPIIISDIGLYAKKGNDSLYVQAVNIINGKPFSNVKLTVKDYYNQTIDEKTSDSEGKCVLNGKEAFFIEAESNGQKTILKLNNTMDMSGFDTEGDGENKNAGFAAFMYTERGVYRPGDEINVSLILRSGEKTVPDNFPVKYTITDPKNRIVNEGINKNGINGFYNFNIQTKDNDMTGDWNINIEAGSAKFSKQLKIETVVPQKIRVNLKAEKEEYNLKQDEIVKFNVNSQYLFGTPGAGLAGETNLTLKNYEVSFKKYKGYIFTNPLDTVSDVSERIEEYSLDENGNIDLEWKLPKVEKILSGLNLEIETKVYEKGGRNVMKKVIVPVSYYNRFVGIKRPDSTYLQIGSSINLKTVLLTKEGLPISGSKLKYRIYKNNYYWWWDYNNQEDFRRNFKSDWNTELLEEGEVITNDEGGIINYTPQTYGEIYLEVEDAVEGHKSGIFFRAYYWGDESNEKIGEKLSVKTDKKEYKIGEKAIVVCDTPIGATAYISLEKEDKILKSFKKDITQEKTEIEIEITEEMFPNAYISVYVVQPQGTTKTDTPLRQYGYVPIIVNDTKRFIEFDINAPDVIEPEKDFEIEVQTKNNKKAQFTVAVVDEGLLNITNFKTPDPYRHFYMVTKAGILNYDMYSEIIGVNLDEVYKTYIIGGDYFREKQLSKGRQDVKRFKAVSMFKEPQYTDEKGYAKVKFKMPNYVGSVKVMVVMANDNVYGSKEKDIIVKTPLMILPTLPRKLSPADKFEIPVSIFATEENIGNVKVSVKTEGPLKIKGDSIKELLMNEKGEKDVFFDIEVLESIGKAKITIEAVSDKYRAYNEIDMPINTSNSYMYLKDTYFKKADIDLILKLNEDSIGGTNLTKITISKYRKLLIGERLKWLIRYPYGCIEQTTSSVFPQLFIEKVVDIDSNEKTKIDNNINSGINRLRKFQLWNGSFSYWPGEEYTTDWGTNYAGHFLVEAKKAGYYVPDSMYNTWLNYQKDTAVRNTNQSYENFYRLYILALAGDPVISSMNYMREAYKTKMSDREKWLLGAAYAITGEKEAAKEIIKDAKYNIADYRELAGTYGSAFRDKSMILEASYYIVGREKAELYSEIAKNIETKNWYSTQETAYALLALARYAPEIGGNMQEVKGKIINEKGNEVNFVTKNGVYIYETSGDKGEVTIKTNEELFVNTEWEGIPKTTAQIDKKSIIELEVKWYNEDGKEINPARLKKGTAFWGVYKVKKDYYSRYDEMALVQNMPSGWEIENVRLLGIDYPNWMSYGYFNQEQYLDIRDDKIMWFFDMQSYAEYYSFAVKVNAVTAGEYYLSGATAEAMYNNDIIAVKQGYKVEVYK